MVSRSEISQHNEYLLNELEAEMANLQELRDKRHEVGEGGRRERRERESEGK